MTPMAQMMASPAVRTGLERTRVYEILSPGQTPLAAAGALPVVSFSSVSELKQAVTGHQLPAGTRAVLYDPEAWSFTPAGEQRDPARAAREAAGIAHAHGLKLIVAEVLVKPTGPRFGEPRRVLKGEDDILDRRPVGHDWVFSGSCVVPRLRRHGLPVRELRLGHRSKHGTEPARHSRRGDLLGLRGGKRVSGSLASLIFGL